MSETPVYKGSFNFRFALGRIKADNRIIDAAGIARARMREREVFRMAREKRRLVRGKKPSFCAGARSRVRGFFFSFWLVLVR